MAKIESHIRWKQVDYMNLGRAIKRFNRTVLSLETDENQAFLPEMQKYKEMKETIQTRAELNRYMKSLYAFQKESNQKIKELESGEKLTVWEYKETQKASKRALSIVDKLIKEEETPLDNGYSMAQMGSLESNRLKQQKANILNWTSKSGTSFHHTKLSIQNLGKLDYNYRRASIFYENYKNVMEKYKGFDNYEMWEKFINTYKNPISFYNRVKEVGGFLIDLTYQSDQYYSQEEFNRFLIEDLGINFEELKLSSKEYKEWKNLDESAIVESYSDYH